MIAVVNYGLGNVQAFINLYERGNVPAFVASNSDDLQKADKIILPGVGAFDTAMRKLAKSKMIDGMRRLVLDHKVPILGVCVGMQILAQSSEEGDLSGLGWIDGVVKKFNVSDMKGDNYLPHMGWNNINPKKENALILKMNNESRFYFLHSYYFSCSNKDDIIATSDYGFEFDSIINNKNIYGVQFHPEKSHRSGEKLLYNFASL